MNKHKGPGACRNAGILKASGEWIAFLDSDDIWEENKIEICIKAIRENPKANFFCHNEIFEKKNGKEVILKYNKRFNNNFNLSTQLFYANMFSTSAVICKKNILINNGCFNETLMSAQDYELWLRLSPILNVIFIKDVLGRYVERKNNITNTNIILRFKNELRIIFLHKNKANFFLIIIRLFRVLLSYTHQLIKKLTFKI